MQLLSLRSFLGADGQRLYHVTVLPGLDVARTCARTIQFGHGLSYSWLHPLRHTRRAVCLARQFRVAWRDASGRHRAQDEARLEGSHPILRGGSCCVPASAESTSASGRPGGIIYYSGRVDAARECLASSHEARLRLTHPNV